MKHLLIFIILWIGCGNLLSGQIQVSGIVTDSESGQPVSLVNVKADPGKGGTTTDQEGKFTLTINRLPVTLRFSHIAYETKNVKIDKNPVALLSVKIKPRVEAIGEVVVEGGKYLQIMKRENIYIIDYEFDQDKIWVIGYAEKSILKPQLVVLTLDGRVLRKLPVRGGSRLYKDAFGWINLMDKESIAGIEYLQNQIRIGESKPFTGWEQNFFDLQMVLGNSAIFKWVYNNGLYCEYALIDFKDTLPVVIHKTYDRDIFGGEGPAKTFRQRSIPDIFMGSFGMGGNRAEVSFDPSDAFTAAAQDRFFKYIPVKTHIFRYRNSFLIFEDRGCHLWKYDFTFTDPVDLKISEPKEARNTDLMQDPVTGNLYLYYTLSGYGYLAGVDPLTGAIQFTQKLENYYRVDNVKVYNNRIWFTHQNTNNQALMNLYSTEIRRN